MGRKSLLLAAALSIFSCTGNDEEQTTNTENISIETSVPDDFNRCLSLESMYLTHELYQAFGRTGPQPINYDVDVLNLPQSYTQFPIVEKLVVDGIEDPHTIEFLPNECYFVGRIPLPGTLMEPDPNRTLIEGEVLVNGEYNALARILLRKE